jgi:hypothetical protein
MVPMVVELAEVWNLLRREKVSDNWRLYIYLIRPGGIYISQLHALRGRRDMQSRAES